MGHGIVNGSIPATFKVTATDNGEPGSNDTFKIEIWPGHDLDTENGDPGRAKHRMQGLRDEIRVEIYLTEAEEADHLGLQSELEAMAGVDHVVYVDKQTALERYREWADEMAALADEFENNPLPASLEVVLAPGLAAPETAARISTAFQGRDEVEEVRFDEAWLQKLQSMVDVARICGAARARRPPSTR